MRTAPPLGSRHGRPAPGGSALELQLVAIDKPDDMNVIVGQAHFIKSVEDIHEALAGAGPAGRRRR